MRPRAGGPRGSRPAPTEPTGRSMVRQRPARPRHRSPRCAEPAGGRRSADEQRDSWEVAAGGVRRTESRGAGCSRLHESTGTAMSKQGLASPDDDPRPGADRMTRRSLRLRLIDGRSPRSVEPVEPPLKSDTEDLAGKVNQSINSALSVLCYCRGRKRNPAAEYGKSYVDSVFLEVSE